MGVFDLPFVMKISDKGIAELASYECICLKPYLDSKGVKTVGIGSTVSDIPDLASWDWGKEISIAEGFTIYCKGLLKYEKALNDVLTATEISQALFDSLVSITYNIGYNGLENHKFIKLINANASLASIVKAMAEYNEVDHKITQGLINRRAKEAKVILEGVYSSKGMVDLVPVINKRPAYKQAKKINIMQYLQGTNG